MKKEVDHTRYLTDEDRVRLYFNKKRGKFVKFIVQYVSKINGKWRSIFRVDTCHGYAHIHTYHLAKREIVVRLSSDPNDNNELFTKYKEYVIIKFQEIKENYLFSK